MMSLDATSNNEGAASNTNRTNKQLKRSVIFACLTF